MGKIFLGVDGGQSSTTALVGDEAGRILGSASGGPCNHVEAAEGRDKFVRAITESISAACRAAGLDVNTVQFEAACLGFSGGAEDKRAIVEQTLRAGHLLVTYDAPIALAGATGGEPGIITNAGTGSIAYGRNAEGKTARAGGWGYIFGDEGSGFDIVRKALRAILQQAEGWGPRTLLHDLLLEATGAPTANNLMHRFYTSEYPRSRVASLAPLVDRAAEKGDEVAAAILHQAANDLERLAKGVYQQLFAPGSAVRVAYIGGVFRSRFLPERFRELVHRELGQSECAPPLYGPAAGALLEAYRVAGLRPALRGLPEFKT